MKRALLILSSLSICSCYVSNRAYNPALQISGYKPPPVPPASVVAVERTTLANERLRTDHVDNNCDPMRRPCLAFLEFDEFGEMWDRCPESVPFDPTERAKRKDLPPACQMDAALRLLERAEEESDHPIVVTFTHGWKNNADDRDGRQNHNVTGFEGVLEFLKTLPKYQNYPIVGIYISWRGDLVPATWPVRRQFSYFNREGAAIRIPGASMTSALTRIMLEAHRRPAAHLIMVGHSFGGLMLERALTQAMTDYVLRNARGATDGDFAWADLVVFVNSAAAATEGKQMLNFLKAHSAFYRVPMESAANDPQGRGRNRPLFVSISSLGDAATRFAVPIGHGIPFLTMKTAGSWRDYGNQADPPGVTSQSSYYLSTTAHMEVLQSHLIVDPSSPSDIARCGNPPSFFGAGIPNTSGKTYRICEKPGRWNDTPYWAMEMPAAIVPDHSSIFNSNFVMLLNAFFLDAGELADPQRRPHLTAR
jgi:hypothetical protein